MIKNWWKKDPRYYQEKDDTITVYCRPTRTNFQMRAVQKGAKWFIQKRLDGKWRLLVTTPFLTCDEAVSTIAVHLGYIGETECPKSG